MSAATTEEARVWRRDASRPELVLVGHCEPVTCCAFVDDDRVVSGGRDNALRLWDVAAGAALAVFEGHEHWVRCCAVRPGSEQIVSGAYDGTLRVWDVNTGATVHVLRHHDKPVVDCAISASGARLVSAALDGQLAIWDLATGALQHVIQAHDEPCAGVAIVGDRLVVSVAQDQWVRGGDLTTGDARFSLLLTGAQDAVAIRTDALAVGDRAGNLWLFDGPLPGVEA